MDFDDIIKAFVPKATRKKVKRFFKKKSWRRLIYGWFQRLIGLIRSRPRQAPPSQSHGRVAPATSRTSADPLQKNLADARAYYDKIQTLAAAAPPDSMRQTRLTLLSERLEVWLTTIESIVAQTQAQQNDPFIDRDRDEVPRAIKRLEKQLARTKDPVLSKKLTRTLESRRRQLEQLEQVANSRQLVELKVENTVAQLGVIYSQLHSSQFVAQRGIYEQLAADIDEEVLSLADYLTVLSDLQSSGEVNSWP
jgi:hypothetical protein